MSSRRPVRRRRVELEWQSWLDDWKMRLVAAPLLPSLAGPLTLQEKQDSPGLQDVITDCLGDPVGCVINPIAENPTSPLLLALIGAVTFGNILVDIIGNIILYLGGGTAVSASKNPPIKKQKEEKEVESPFFPFLPGGCSKCNY